MSDSTKRFLMLIAGCLLMSGIVSSSAKFSDLSKLLPVEVHGWRSDGKYYTYDPQTIFDYINGANEIYRTYNLMMDEAVTALGNVKHPIEAWEHHVKSGDLVGIKSNVWAYLPTPREIEETIKQRLCDADVKEESIRLDDRGARSTLSPCTALINIRPLRTHWWSVIGGCIKN